QPAPERKSAPPPAVSPARPSTAPAAVEVPKPDSAANARGAARTGPAYTVAPTTRSDGIMRIFRVDSTYGQYDFDGVEFTKLRLREIAATAALEKMSKSEEWAKSFGNAAVSPLNFCASFIANPAEAINRSASGISNMFDRVDAS